MAKTSPRPDRGAGNFDVASHMDLWRRLTAVVNMHGTPGDRRPKGK